MLSSLLIKLVMMVVTMALVFWIGWSVPQSRHGEDLLGRGSVQSAKLDSQRATGPAALTAGVPEQLSGRSASVKLDLNMATEQEIESLPGIGPVLAGRIVEYRQSRGAFRTVDQLRHVKGIGKKKFDRIRMLVNVSTPPGSGGGKRKAA